MCEVFILLLCNILHLENQLLYHLTKHFLPWYKLPPMKADFFYLDINHRRDVTLTTLISIYFHGPIALSTNISISISSNDISSLRWKLRGRLTEASDHYNLSKRFGRFNCSVNSQVPVSRQPVNSNLPLLVNVGNQQFIQVRSRLRKEDD